MYIVRVCVQQCTNELIVRKLKMIIGRIVIRFGFE